MRDPGMHVLVVNNIYPPIMAGGAELVVADLCQGLVSRGYRVTVVSTCGPEQEPYPVEVREGVTVIRFFPRNLYWNFARDGQPSVRRMLWHLRDAWNRDAARRFRAILEQAPPAIVHTHLIDGFSASIWRRARRAGVPLIHTAHDYHLLCPRAFLLDRQWRVCRRPGVGCQLYRAWHLRTAGAVDLFVSPSRFLLDRHRQAGLAPEHQAVVRNGIPLPRDAARIRAARRGGRKPGFLLMCRLTVEKGVRVALRAAALLPRELDFELVIAGRGPLEQEVRAAAAADPRIRFVGYVSGEEKLARLAEADHLLVPSLWYENAPLAVIEAAAYGLGLLGSRIGGIPEMVREGRTGLLFEPGDSGGLANAMLGLARGVLTLNRLDEASWDLANEHTVDRMVDGYLSQYSRLLAAHAIGRHPALMEA
jgi:glycosyltransferase involved in cell wall biosynthesis